MTDGLYRTVLDRSAFYPTSGGQSHDIGHINKVVMIDVVESDDAGVVHISEEAVGQVGEVVKGKVDARRRLLHCQLHTAQHILSQVFMQQAELVTMSVHLGEEYGAVELSAASLTEEQLHEAELKANRFIDHNYPINIIFTDSDKLEKIPLRKQPKREGKLRVISIGEIEYSACGGTHCRSTAEVQAIKIIGTEKLRGHALVKFLVGSQIRQDYKGRFEITEQLAHRLTCSYRDLPAKYTKLEDENKALIQTLHAQAKELLPLRVEKLLTTQTSAGSKSLVVAEWSGGDPSVTLQLAKAVCDKTEGITLLVSEGKLVLAVSEKSSCHAGQLMKSMTAAFGLKGGGNGIIAQAGGAKSAEIEAYREYIKKVLTDG